jgi:hypothetical protein
VVEITGLDAILGWSFAHTGVTVDAKGPPQCMSSHGRVEGLT